MKVYVVIKTSYSPNYEGDATEYQSVDKIFATEHQANMYVNYTLPASKSAWDSEYEIEEHEVE